ncbi:MAG: hypothetical protein ACON34_07225 [Flavobacteriales bacterium]
MRTRMTMLALLVTTGLSAQNVLSQRDYFDNAAKQFLDGKKKEAIQTLESGLKAYPNDSSMEKLAEALLKEMEQQQQQQQNQQQEQQSQQEQQENQNGSDGNNNPEQNKEQNGDTGKDSQGDSNRDPEDGGEQSEGNEDPGNDRPQDDSEPERNTGEDGQPKDPGASGGNTSNGEQEEDGKPYSRGEAERMLKALNAQDQATKQRVLRAQQRRKGKSSKSEKDW